MKTVMGRKVVRDATGDFFEHGPTAYYWRRGGRTIEEVFGVSGDCDSSNKQERRDGWRRFSRDGRFVLIASATWESEGFDDVKVYEVAEKKKPTPPAVYALVDTFMAIPGDSIGTMLSRHRTVEAAQAADGELQRAIRRGSGRNSYLPTQIVRLTRRPRGRHLANDEWVGVTLTDDSHE